MPRIDHLTAEQVIRALGEPVTDDLEEVARLQAKKFSRSLTDLTEYQLDLFPRKFVRPPETRKRMELLLSLRTSTTQNQTTVLPGVKFIDFDMSCPVSTI